jgi:hypothetical protein
MEFQLNQEQRNIVSERRNSGDSIVTAVPDTTAPHIVARLKAGLAAIFEKRSVSVFDELLYQDQSNRAALNKRSISTPADEQPSCHRPKGHEPGPDKVLCEECTRTSKRKTYHAKLADVDQRHGKIASEYRYLSYDQIKRAVRLGYDTDTLNALNLAMLAKQI